MIRFLKMLLALFTSSPSTSGSTGVLPKDYDEIFARYGGECPVEYLRALSWSESRMDEKERRPVNDSYWGLMQVGYRDVLPDFNRAHAVNYEPEDLFDPEINVEICCWQLNRIAKAHRASFPKMKLFNDDSRWRDPEFVKILTAAWNSGWSKRGGTQKVIRFLIEQGIPVTHDNIFAHAHRAGATRHLQIRVKSSQKKLKWQRRVARYYFRELQP